MKKLLILISIVAASMFSTASAAVGDQTTIVDQTFTGSPTLSNTAAYSWGTDIQGMLTSTGIYMTNASNKANNYENRDFLTFPNAVGDATHELNISYEVYSPRDKGQDNTYYTINYFNADGNFVFGIQEASGGWGYSANVITANEDGTTTTTALSKGHMSKGGGSVVNATIKFGGTNAIVIIDGGSYLAYTSKLGINSVKLSVTGESGFDRDMYIKNYVLKTVESEKVEFATYKLKYVVGSEVIKEVENSGIVGFAPSLTVAEKTDFTENGKKYIYISNDAEEQTIAPNGSTVVTITCREAETYNYTVKANVDDKVIATGSVFEKDNATVPYSRYILAEDGTVWEKYPGKNTPYTHTFTPNKDEFVETLGYTTTDIANCIYFVEGEDIEGMETVTRDNANARCSNAAGGYAEESVVVKKLQPGKYKVTIGVWGNGGATFVVKAGEEVLSAETQGYWLDATSDEFIISTETDLTFEGATNNKPLDYILIQKTGEYVPKAEYTLIYVLEGTSTSIKTPEKREGEVGSTITLSTADKASFYNEDHTLKYKYVSDDSEGLTIKEDNTTEVTITMKAVEPRMSWDFTKWSSSTVDNLKADENWSDIEKKDASEPTELSKDNCFWQVDLNEGLDADKNLMANKKVIEELEGLVYTNETGVRNLAIAVDYQTAGTDKGFGPYEGKSYLWLGGKEINYFIIPDVPAGATIKMGVESHNTTDARGVKLLIAGEELKAPNGDDVTLPTTYDKKEWFVPKTAAAINDVQIYNTNGCHIYYITVSPYVEVENLAINDKDGNEVKTLTIKANTTYQLSATITPEEANDKTVTWESSDEEIATVDKTGKVTALATGETVITATSSNGKTATCTITVEEAVIEVKSISLDQEEASVAVGESIELKATVDPADAAVTWSSDKEDVATVENGIVTAVAAGTATITATAGEKTATCNITVTVPVDGITINFKKITVEKGDEFSVGYKISPEDATDKTVTWTSSDEEVVTVDGDGNVKALADGEAIITAKAGTKEATCTINVVTTEVVDGVKVRMTYVDGTNCVLKDQTTLTNRTDAVFGQINAGETAIAGYNKISGGSVGFGTENWGVNYITYLQVDASAIKDNYITSATLSFEASGSTDSGRTTGWGVGYNSSKWASTMTYNSADKSITKLDSEKWTSTKSATTFETFSFDITEAINKADGRKATILVYELAPAGGYIKNPVVKIESTNELVYKVTFTETGEAEGVKVTVNDQDATNGISLPNGTYSFTANAAHCKDYTGEFTVADEDLNVEFEITPREVWSYTVNAVDANGDFLKELSKGEGYEEENVTYYFPGYYLQGNTLLSKSNYKRDPYYGETELLDSNGKVFEVKYDGTHVSDVVFYKEAEDIDEFISKNTNNAPIRCSNGLGGIVDGEVILTTLPAGKYQIHGQVWGTKGLTAGVKIKATSEEEEDQNLWTLESTGSLKSGESDEFTLEKETALYVYTTSGNDNRMLDYIYITKINVPVTGIVLNGEDGKAISKLELKSGEGYSLTAVVSPEDATDKNVTWTSSDENVATVNAEGKVTAVKAGKATITATCGEVSAVCAITCYAEMGDANGNGEIDITDATYIAAYILEEKEVPAGLTEKEWLNFADVNKDDHISISDASATVSLVLEQEKERPNQSQARVAANYEYADNLVIGGMTTANGKTSVAVTLDNSTDFVAVQADIFMPEGVYFDVKPGSRIANSHSFQTKRFDDNHVRVVIYTFSGNAFADNNEALFEIVADSYISDPTDIALAYMLASDAAANAYTLGARYDGTTGVAALGFDSNAPVKVYDLNGRYISDKVEGLEQGFYIIRQGDNAKKVHMR